MKAGAAVLVDHGGDQIGVVKRAWIADEKLYCEIKFSKSGRGNEIYEDIIDGIRQNVSIGYRINDLTSGEKINNKEVYIINSWMPYEVSIVGIPADFSVGVGRKESISVTQPAEIKYDTDTENKINQNNGKEEMESLNALEEKRNAEIIAIGNKHKLPTAWAIESGLTAEQFRNYALEQISKQQAYVQPASEVGLSKKEIKKYSIVRAIKSQLGGEFARQGAFEMEVSDVIARQLGKDPQGIYIPHEYMTRDLNTTDETYLIGTMTDSANFIELLRNKMLASKLGVKILSNLKGNVSIPKQATSATAYWVAEGNAPTQSEMTISQVILTPKTVAGWTKYSRQLMLQSTPDIESLVVDDLTKVISLACDKALFHGLGNTNQPSGIAVSASGSVTASSFTWAKAIEFETDVMSANADINSMYYVTTPTIYGTLKSRLKDSGIAGYIIDNKMMNGYPVEVSNQISTGYIFFGDFSQAIMGEWGVLDLLVNPYIDSTTGSVVVTGFYNVDYALRQAGAFSVGASFS